MMRFAFAFAAAASVVLMTSEARAGGMDLPDNGTEALGRGGAFTAKADDPTAIYYNVAGLAEQRGTRVLANANVSKQSLSFERAGVYPGDPATQPYAGKPFPKLDSEGGISAIPFLAITSDLGLDNVTFALGTFAPPAVGNRVYPLTTADGLPGPARYDSVGGMSSVLLFHTAAVGFKLGDYVDIGIAAHVAQIEIGTRLVNYMDTLGSQCAPKLENQTGCDARGEGTLKTWSGTASAGALVHVREDVSLGFHVKGPTHISAEGVATLSPPNALKTTKVPPSRVALTTELPWIFRTGVRKTFGPQIGRRNPQAYGDLELDVTYELWGQAMNPGPQIVLESIPGHAGPLHKTVTRGYRDTFSVRAGGSITPDLPIPLTLRGGAYYDSSATPAEYTRLDTDTLEKVAITAGAGLRFDAWRLDLAIASVFDISRSVEHGALTNSSAAGAKPVNEGVYAGSTQIISLGATIELDVLIGSPRLPSLKKGERLAKATR